MTLTTDNCFQSKDFVAFITSAEKIANETIERPAGYPDFCFDDGFELEIVLDYFNTEYADWQAVEAIQTKYEELAYENRNGEF